MARSGSMTPGSVVDGKILTTLKKAKRPLTSVEIGTITDLRSSVLHPGLTRLRVAGQIRRRPPTEKELADGKFLDVRGQMRYVYELGSGSEHHVDPRAKAAKKLTLEELLTVRAGLRDELEQVEAQIEAERVRLQGLLDLITGE